jgi:hypothetical protein
MYIAYITELRIKLSWISAEAFKSRIELNDIVRSKYSSTVVPIELKMLAEGSENVRTELSCGSGHIGHY